MKDLVEYQQKALETAIYPEPMRVKYPATGMIGESGEVADKVKKILRDDNSVLTSENRKAVALELGDVMWYIVVLAHDLQVNLRSIKCPEYWLKEEDTVQDGFLFDVNDLCRSTSILAHHSFRGSSIEIPFDTSACLSALSRVAADFGFTLDEIAKMNINKLQSRKERGKINGSGDYR